jgi:UDP-N-acetylmuramyl pentapeptide phosphotransferase/UDP-N-acetylglucosamine-1-phosphate transferase
LHDNLTDNNMAIIFVITAFIIGLILVLLSIPHVLSVAREKKLYDSFNDERKIHKQVVPPLGGVAIFFGFTLSTIASINGYSFDSLKYIVAASILLFLIGLKDDLVVISAKKKLIGQLFAAIIIIISGKLYFTSLHGVFGIYEIPPVAGILLTLFVMVVIINAFNLIDGIDGLASGLAILSATVFGVWFFLAGQIPLAIMSFALVGSLTGFFAYNVFGHKNKLFMGDSGSLVVGLIISTLVIKFNELNIANPGPFSIHGAPAVSFVIILIPMIDTLRVMSIRMHQKKSPFSPDNNHIHHRLLSLVPHHFKVTLIIVFTNAILIISAFMCNNFKFNVNYLFLSYIIIGFAVSAIPMVLIKFRKKKKEL